MMGNWGNGYLWVKSLHIVFVVSWFAALFYLPRIFVNLAMDEHPAVQARLLAMAKKLYRFGSWLMTVAIVLGAILWLHYGIGKGPGSGWMHAKLLIVAVLVGYQHICKAHIRRFESGSNRKSHVWFRWFNEVPVLALLLVVVLVVLKPF